MKTPRWFALLLRLLPEAFRRDHAEEIRELAREETGPSGVRWVPVAADLIKVAVSMRLRQWRPAALRRDLASALRALRRAQGISAFAILTIGLGTGAVVTVFSVADALLLRPLPFEEPERLVLISNGEFGRGQQLSELSTQVIYLRELREEASLFEDVAGYHMFDQAGDHILSRDGGAHRLTRLRATANLLDVLGIEPALGRAFSAEEAQDGGPSAILLTHESWRARFAADPDIVGNAVIVDGAPTTVVGVLGADFDFGSVFRPGQAIDYVAPYALSERNNRQGNTMVLVGRLASGATVAAAQRQAAELAGRETADADRRNGFRPMLIPLRQHVSGGSTVAVWGLTAAVALVMLIVCANLSNLLLARGAARAQEMAIRTALGAERSVLVRQLALESLLLATAGGALGLGLAASATRVAAALPIDVALLDSVRLDSTALSVALLAVLVTAMGFGTAPALRQSDVSVERVLREGGRAATGGRGARGRRHVLVGAQVGLASVLLVWASLMLRSFVALAQEDLGFQPERTVTLRIDPVGGFGSEAERASFMDEALRRARSAASVEAAGLTDVLPTAFNRRWGCFRPDGAEARPEDCPSPYIRVVTEDFVAAMGLRLLRGRDLSASDDRSARGVALVNDRLAQRLWPDTDPVGRTLSAGWSGSYTVVGVVQGTRYLDPDQEPGSELFIPMRQVADHARIHLVARGRGTETELVSALTSSLAGLHPDVPLGGGRSVGGIVGRALAPGRVLVAVIAGFAGFALLLAALGLYAVVAHAVGQRRRELGIRLALGASGARLQGEVVRETGVVALFGLTAGMVAALLASRLLEGMLYGVTPTDPATYVVVAALLTTVAALAAWLPARAATRIDAAESLSPQRRSDPD